MCELMCVSASASAARTTSTLTYNASSVRLVNNREVNVEWTEREEHTSDCFHGVWLRHNCLIVPFV